MSENLYNVLGINENADVSDIKKAYRSLSLKYHPDKNGGDPEAVSKFQKISEAYEILGDTQKRKEYDMTRNFSANIFGGQQFSPKTFNMNSDIPLDDILGAIFSDMSFSMQNGFSGMPLNAKFHVFNGNGGPINMNMPMHMNMGLNQALQKPVPINKTIKISLEQVYNGTKISVDIERWIMENGLKMFEKETLYVDISQGIDDGEIIILRDKGNILNFNNKGDVKIFIQIINESCFKRSGMDLVFDKTISLKDSLCGFTFEIKHLNGKTYTLNNNSGNIITPNYRKIIPNMGIIRDTHVGNMIIQFNTIFPESLTNEQITKLREIL